MPRTERARFKNARPDAFVQAGQDQVTPGLAGHLRVDEQMDLAVEMIAVRAARPRLRVGRFPQPIEERAPGKRRPGP